MIHFDATLQGNKVNYKLVGGAKFSLQTLRKVLPSYWWSRVACMLTHVHAAAHPSATLPLYRSACLCAAAVCGMA